MAIALLAQRLAANKGLQTATSTVSPTGTVSAGNLLLIFTACGGSSKVPVSVTDDAGNAYVVDEAPNDGTRGLGVIRCQVTTDILTTNVITITWSDATSRSVQVWLQEITGASPSGAFDTFQVGSSASGSALSAGPTPTLVQSNEMVWGLFAWSGAHTWTKGASYSDPTTPTINSTASLEYKIVASTAAVTADGSLETSTAWLGVVVTYTEVLASPSVSPSLSASISKSPSASPSPSHSLSSSVSASPSPSSSVSASRSPSLSASISKSPSSSVSKSRSSSLSASNSPSQSLSCCIPAVVVAPVITGVVKVGFTVCVDTGTWECC